MQYGFCVIMTEDMWPTRAWDHKRPGRNVDTQLALLKGVFKPLEAVFCPVTREDMKIPSSHVFISMYVDNFMSLKPISHSLICDSQRQQKQCILCPIYLCSTEIQILFSCLRRPLKQTMNYALPMHHASRLSQHIFTIRGSLINGLPSTKLISSRITIWHKWNPQLLHLRG
jgi:hypothetical protein